MLGRSSENGGAAGVHARRGRARDDVGDRGQTSGGGGRDASRPIESDNRIVTEHFQVTGALRGDGDGSTTYHDEHCGATKHDA